MSKANEPAYPHSEVYTDKDGYAKAETISGLTKREKLAMEIYALRLANRGNFFNLEEEVTQSIRAADIFFEQLNKSYG